MDDSKNEGKERGITEHNKEGENLKIITIKHCFGCPYYKTINFEIKRGDNDNNMGRDESKYYCQYRSFYNKNIENPTKIPDWCQLEDYKK